MSREKMMKRRDMARVSPAQTLQIHTYISDGSREVNEETTHGQGLTCTKTYKFRNEINLIIQECEEVTSTFEQQWLDKFVLFCGKDSFVDLLLMDDK